MICSGDPSRGEGGDYITEAENRHLKMNLPPGVPTLRHWVTALRNHDILVENRKKVLDRLGMQDPNVESSIFNFDPEISMFRKVIRESQILDNPYDDEDPLRNIEGGLLHPELVNFYFTAQENYEAYLRNPSSDLSPVFITQEDEEQYNNVKNWTIKKIKSKCGELIQSFLDDDLKEKYSGIMKSITKANKGMLISFYEELRQNLSSIQDSDYEEDEEEDDERGT